MKRFKIKETDSDYKLWGLSIPKIQNAHLPQAMRRERSRKDIAEKEPLKPAVNDKLTTVHSAGDAVGGQAALDNSHTVTERRAEGTSPPGARREKETSHENSCQPDRFSDIVFSFFSSSDQTYVVRGSSGDYVDANAGARCESVGSGNEYEIMNAKPATVAHYASVADVNSDESETYDSRRSPKLHKSELRFYVSAASLKGDKGPGINNPELDYDLPANRAVSNINNSNYIIQNKSLNDVNEEKRETPKYQNSTSLDNLSQVCNISLKNADSKRSIASLPELESLNRKARDLFQSPFAFPKIASVINTKSVSDRSSYFENNQRAIRLKNRISAFYSAHKSFKGKKRLSKAWYGIKEWFELEKIKMDKVISKHNPKKVAPRSSEDDYPDSDFSDYEDVADEHGSVDSFGKINETGGASVISGCSNASETKLKRKAVRSLSACNSAVKLDMLKDDQNYFRSNSTREGMGMRHSRSQPSVLLISEPVLVKVNCGEAERRVDSSLCEDDRELLTVNSTSPDCESVKSDNCEDVTDSMIMPPQSNEQNNFSALRSIVKEGSVMCKELISILQQRAEIERQYCCGVLRVGARARRASKGTSWAALASRRAAIDMEIRAQMHRQFSNRLVEEIIRPLQRLVSSRDAVRKQVDSDVGRAVRRLNELRDCEARCKKSSHAAARVNERLQDTSVTKGGTPSQEVELKRKKLKSDEAASKGDVEYYMACIRAERARVEWETSVAKGLEALVELEEERLGSMKKALKRYVTLASTLGPGGPSEESRQLDGLLADALRGEGRVARGLLLAPPPPMHLPDFYSQHTTLAMNKERRKEALNKIVQLIKNDMERERKSKQALEKLSRAITTTPNFGSNDSQQNVSEKLYHMRSLLTYLEGARVQATGALLALSGRVQPPHPLTPHLRLHRDRRGLQQTILMVPPWLRQELRPLSARRSCATDSPPATPSVARSSPPPSPASSLVWDRDRGAADGVSVLHYSDIDDNILDTPPIRPPPPMLPIFKKHTEYSQV